MQKMILCQRPFSLVVIGSILVAFSVEVSAEVSETNKRTFCGVPAAKRMLSSLGLAAKNDESCLLKSKRDIANLVGSYMETNLENLTKTQDKRSMIERLEDFLQDESLRTKRAYCCSPKCDKFMSTMGNPDPMTVKCN